MVKDDTSIKIKQELEESRKSEALLASLLENSSQPFGVGYPDGHLGLVNKAFEKLTGYSREELKDTDWSKILTPNKFRDMENEKLKVLQSTGKPVRYEKEYIRKDGTIIPIELLVHIIKNEDGSPEYYYSFITDISERKRTEKYKQELLEKEQQLTEELTVSNEELQSTFEELQVTNEELMNQEEELLKINKAFELSERRYRNILDNLQDAYIRTDKDGIIIMANTSAARMYGYDSPQDMNGIKALSFYKNPEDRIYFIEELEKHGKLENNEVEALKKDGALFFTSQNAQFYYDENRRVQGTETLVRDITERKKFEESFRENEERLRLAQTSGNVGVWDWNTITNGLNFTPELEQLYGLNPGTIKTYNDWRQLTHPDDIEIIEHERDEKIANHEQFDLEFRIFHKSGEIRWLSAKGGGIYNQDGDLTRVLGINMDITKRKNAEEELKKRVALLDISYEAIFSWDLDKGIRSWNHGAEMLYGYALDEAIACVSHDLLKTQFPIEFEEFQDILTKEKKWTGELVHTTKDGKKIIVETRQQMIQDSSGINVIIETNRDITEKKKAEEDLKQSQKLLQDVINGFPSPIFVKDTEGRFLIINNKLEELLGVKNEELKGKTDYDIITKELAEYYMVNDQKVLEEGKPIVIEEEAEMIDGHHTYIANKFPIYDNKSEPYGVGSISTDITERKILENQMKITMDELKRSNEELERFAYVSSHDLQEPLRMVTLYSQLLERRYKDSLDSDADDFIEYIVENAKRMKQLIDDLLDYSRVTNQAKEFENVDLEKILDVVLINLSGSMDENTFKVTHKPLPTVLADQNQMLQVFQNLITNATKFHGKKPPEINISAENGDNEWIFSISDNGIGIKPEHQKQIFDVFKRLHNRDEYPGTGIGLSIVQKIIKHHGGRIWVESEPGKGSTFYFTIPNK
jgi:PAS domain S-box-containing protein